MSGLGLLPALRRNRPAAGLEAEEELHGLLPARIGQMCRLRWTGRKTGRPLCRDRSGRVDHVHDWLESIRDFLNTAPPATLLAAAFLSGVIETVLPPFPSEGLLLLTSFAGARRGLGPWLLVIVSTVGSFASLYLLFLLGRGRLRETVRRKLRRWIGRSEEEVPGLFRRWGYGAVLVSRFLPAVRGPLTFLAGVYGLKPLQTAVTLFAGCLIWNALVIHLGHRTGGSWDGSTGGLLRVGLLLAGAVVFLWGIGVVAWRLLRRPAL